MNISFSACVEYHLFDLLYIYLFIFIAHIVASFRDYDRVNVEQVTYTSTNSWFKTPR